MKAKDMVSAIDRLVAAEGAFQKIHNDAIALQRRTTDAAFENLTNTVEGEVLGWTADDARSWMAMGAGADEVSERMYLLVASAWARQHEGEEENAAVASAIQKTLVERMVGSALEGNLAALHALLDVDEDKE